jgi:sugar/nucleoside kinase (ribokinase family)
MLDSSISLDFFALGEALIDLISENIADSLSKTKVFNSFVGGQPTNLTMTMARLGNRTAIATCLGEDGFGHSIYQEFNQVGVLTDYVQFTSKAPTTLVVNTRQTKTPDFAIYRGADSLLNQTPEHKEVVQNSRIVHTSAFALAREPARSAILQSLCTAHEFGNLVSFDPNYHPRNWPDIPDFIATLHRVFQLVDVTKPSIEDCARLIGPDLTINEYADAFLELGAKIVLITQGAKGVFLATSEGARYHIHASPIMVVDVTGAGDAFWAGFLTSCLEGASPLKAARLGQVVAEIKLKTLGPIVHLPERAALDQLAQNIEYSLVTNNSSPEG